MTLDERRLTSVTSIDAPCDFNFSMHLLASTRCSIGSESAAAPSF